MLCANDFVIDLTSSGANLGPRFGKHYMHKCFVSCTESYSFGCCTSMRAFNGISKENFFYFIGTTQYFYYRDWVSKDFSCTIFFVLFDRYSFLLIQFLLLLILTITHKNETAQTNLGLNENTKKKTYQNEHKTNQREKKTNARYIHIEFNFQLSI